MARLEVIGLCKAAGFTQDEIQVLFADDAPGRPASKALAEAKLVEIDARIESLTRACGHRMGDALHLPVDRRVQLRHSTAEVSSSVTVAPHSWPDVTVPSHSS